MLIYGINPVLEAIKARRATRVRVGPRGLVGLYSANARSLDAILPAMGSRLAEVVRAARDAGIDVDVVDVADIERASRGGVHQGVIAEVSRGDETWTPESLVAAARGPALIVVLDGIEDPHNVGAILRSADAAGADGVVRQTRHAAKLDGAAAKASAGAVSHVRIASVVNVARAIEELKGAGVWTLGLAGDAGDPYDEVDLRLPTAIVVGAEGDGLRRLVRERCDRLVRIPMHGRVTSLNASVAASVVLFEARRQRRHAKR
jgi:23S rRNA (guanosine2251-2'-O)-methyltransferase